jgi:hypothetical protein
VSLPLAVWLTASRRSADGLSSVGVSSHDVTLWGAIGLAGLAVYTAARYGLMGVFSPPGRPA